MTCNGNKNLFDMQLYCLQRHKGLWKKGFFLLLIKMILLPIGPYTMLPCSFKIFKADSLSSLQIDCGTLVILNPEHVTDEDEQGCWIGGIMTGALKLLKWSIFLKGNHVIFIALKTIFFSDQPAIDSPHQRSIAPFL